MRMKRSDALNIIWEAINELEDANYILTKLEEAGMLPTGFWYGISDRNQNSHWKY